MSKKLIFLTNGYPYDNSESYIETEINYLSRCFDQINIFSLKEEMPKFIRIIPSNCFHFCFIPNKRVFLQFKGITSLMFYKLLFYKHNAKLTSLAYLIGRDKSFFNYIKKICNKKFKNSYVVYSYWLTLGYASYMLGKYYKCPTYSRCHGYDVYSERMSFDFLPLQKFLLFKIKIVFACSLNGINYLKDKYGSKIHISLSRLGVDNDSFNVNLYDTNSFVTCCNNSPVKRIWLFASAFEKAVSINRSLKWYCLGLTYNDIEKYISSDLRNNIICLGVLSNSDIYKFYNNIPVGFFVNVSSSEGIPVSIMEAISFGIPTLACNVGGNSEIVFNNISGFLIKKDLTAEDLCNEILKLSKIDCKTYVSLRQTTKTFYQNNYCGSVNYLSFCSMISS